MTYQEKEELMKLFVILVVLVLAGWLGYCIGQHQTRREAARYGVGEFVTKAPDDPNTVWRWNTQTNR